MRRLGNTSAIAIIILSSTAILFAAFSKLILSPQQWMFAHMSGDGLKNYFTVMYYTKFDSGVIFSGMNYPYGEYFHYIDCHPILSTLLGFIQRNITPIDHFMPGLLSYWLLILIPLGSTVIYFLLRQFNLPRYYAIICALIITFLSPQIDRISDHHALSNIFIIPLAWLLFIKMYTRTAKVHLYGIALTIFFLVSGWIHAYYVPIIGFFLLAIYVLIVLTTQLEKKNVSLFIYPLMGMILTYLSLSLFDPFTNRPVFPWGIGVYTTTWEGVILPSKGFIHILLNKIINIRDTSWEGQSYLGLPAMFIIIFSIIHVVSKWVNKKKSRITSNRLLGTSVLAGLIIFLFGTGFFHLYIFKGNEDLLKPLYQFRSLGRFAWALYYPFCVFVAYMMYVLYRHISLRHSKIIASLLLVGSLAIWTLDATIQLAHEKNTGVHKNLMLDKTNTIIEDLLSQAGYSIDQFQATLPLPYTNIGAKLLTKYDGAWVFGYAMRLAYAQQIPIIGLFTARPSAKHSSALRQLFSAPFIKKEMLDQMNDKPILIIHKGELKTEYEKMLLSLADPIVKNEKFDLYKLLPDKLAVDYSTLSNNGISFDSLTVLSKELNQTIIPDTSEYRYESLDRWDHEVALSGGSRYLRASDMSSSSLTIGVENLTKSKSYNVSFWIHLDNTVKKTPILKIHEWNWRGDAIKTHHIWWRFEADVYKNWIRVNRTIQFHEDTFMLTFEVFENDMHVDEILIQELGSDFLIVKENELMINNYILRAPTNQKLN